MSKCCFLLIILQVTLSSTSAETGGSLVSVDNVEFYGKERFPEVVDVFFGYQGNDIFLQLVRDDELTGILSEDLFETSRILPSGLFKEENTEQFAAYNSGDSDVVVIHRESEDAKPKFYGRFSQNNEKMLIQADDGNNELHRVRREDKLELRKRRSTPSGEIIELFVFADLSVYEHVKNEYKSGTTQQLKELTRDYIRTITKEVDFIYQYLGKYGTNNVLRVYFQQYQIITDSTQQKWVTDNYSGGKLQTAALSDFQTYYNKLISKFSFPDPDHVVALTRLDIQGDEQVLHTGTICGTSSTLATSIASIQSYPVSIAQALAYSFGVQADSATSCPDSDQYIMSNDYRPYTNLTNQGNRWKFSNCSVQKFIAAFAGEKDVSCLQTQDTVFNLDAYDKSLPLSQRFTLAEQCVLRYQNGSTSCGTVDCYSSSNGCQVGSECLPIYTAEGASCISGRNFVCEFGVCDGTSTDTTSISTTTDSDLQTTTSTPTENTEIPTTSSPDCVIETGFVEFDLPGCGCCGGCGCDSECSDCVPGLPSKTQTESCTKEANCCNSKVRMTTLFVPTGCELTYKNGPRTIVMEKKGWEDNDAEVTAEVYQDNNDRWQVNLVPLPKSLPEN